MQPDLTLIEQIAITPRYRQNGLWPDAKNLVICALPSTWEKSVQKVREHCPEAEIRALCLPGDGAGRNYPLPVISSSALVDFPDCDIVVCWDESLVPDVLYHLNADLFSPAIFPHVEFGSVGRKYAPDLLRRHGEKLEAIYNRLSDGESRKAFASVVKALITGEIEWLKQSGYAEYEHPVTLAQAGDIIIDAGLFDSVVLRRFALAATRTCLRL